MNVLSQLTSGRETVEIRMMVKMTSNLKDPELTISSKREAPTLSFTLSGLPVHEWVVFGYSHYQRSCIFACMASCLCEYTYSCLSSMSVLPSNELVIFQP